MKIAKINRIIQLTVAVTGSVVLLLSPIVLGVMGTTLAHAQGVGPYTKIDLGSLGGGYTDPTSISNNSIVAGIGETSSGASHAFMWQNGSIEDLGTLGGDSFAYDVNDAGHVVGTSDTSPWPQATLWENGNAINLSTIVGDDSYAYGINNSDQIVGSAIHNGQTTGFMYQNGRVTYLNPGFSPSAINDNGQVVGFTFDDSQSVIWQNGTAQYLPSLPGDTITQALDISNDGTIIGYGSGPDRNYHALVWKNGQVSKLPELGSDNIARSLNSNDQVVGDGFVSPGQHDPILWQGSIANDLGPGPNSAFSAARDINDFGQIVAYYDDGSSRHAQLWTPSDSTAPVLNVPSTITVNATSQQGTVVNYSATATDPDNPSSELTISCSPSSGSTFPIGTTTVNCSASDPAGNTSVGRFSIVVNGASTQTTNLIALTNSLNLAPGTQNSFDAKLQAVQSALNTNDTTTACSTLAAYINEVNAQSGKKLTTDQADQLIIAAEQIKAAMGC